MINSFFLFLEISGWYIVYKFIRWILFVISEDGKNSFKFFYNLPKWIFKNLKLGNPIVSLAYIRNGFEYLSIPRKKYRAIPRLKWISNE